MRAACTEMPPVSTATHSTAATAALLANDRQPMATAESGCFINQTALESAAARRKISDDSQGNSVSHKLAHGGEPATAATTARIAPRRDSRAFRTPASFLPLNPPRSKKVTKTSLQDKS